MVAGMLMPRDRLRAIYELLFRDGVMVAMNDERPQSHHAEVPGVTNLQVTKAMGSLKSRGFVRETFAWKHCYWYLTNEGIVYLRQYLNLPPEIVPAPLQRVRRPVSAQGLPRRTPAAHVQAVRGPTSYVPKPQVDAERQEYRRKEETAPPPPPPPPLPQRGQNAVHGSIKTHVLENSCQEGGWQRWAEQDDRARGTSHTSVISPGEAWGTKHTQRREETSKRHVGEQASVGSVQRGHVDPPASASWADDMMFGRTQGLRKEGTSRRHTVTENAELSTSPGSVTSSYKRPEMKKREEKVMKEEKIESNHIVSRSVFMSEPQNAAKRSSSKVIQKSEEPRTVTTEKSVDVVTSVVSTHNTLEVHEKGGKPGVSEKPPVQEHVLDQESKQKKNQEQLIEQVTERGKEAAELVKPASASDKTRLGATQKVKHQGNISAAKSEEDGGVIQTHVLSASKPAAQQESEMLQKQEELIVTAGPMTATIELPKTQTKVEEKRVQKKKGKEKAGKEGATEDQNDPNSESKKTHKPSNSVSKGVKSEPKKGPAIEVTTEVALKCDPKKEGKSKTAQTSEDAAGLGGLPQRSSELVGETISQGQNVKGACSTSVTSTNVQTEQDVSGDQDKKGSKGKKQESPK
ncbi:unnamed protein product [Ranitomeya imitator]|uniref:Plectin/eS10 N-terminal domain-containing protein n=1 Tax=Ranitomeya imitator TaxID=111125 RepID=A0ABN9LT65_9NEOB|nr:unnamed protein product [Ranitomeya imitator]